MVASRSQALPSLQQRIKNFHWGEGRAREQGYSYGTRYLALSPSCTHPQTVEAKYTTTSEKNAKMKEAMKVAEQKVAQTQAQVQM